MNFDKETKSGIFFFFFFSARVGGGGGGGVWLIRMSAGQESKYSLNISISSHIIKFLAPSFCIFLISFFIFLNIFFMFF